jgi:hypothetical protein
LAKPNYRQQKRQKELSRKSRQAERLQRRTSKLEGEEANPDTAGVAGTETQGTSVAGASAEPAPLPATGIAPKVTP